ncbi:protein NRT1/ PTR FAMILY 1.2-like [Phragmites australis]|uniref:protein NRT1/ PTR FAMILY 1.2-like n=1 Tax=Phragmites australis TaxID=29695 RepID=UPI002D783E1C|nr:protein NRT1/ PTR FAMILY 1.2-like [Phragmites australis]
MEVSAMEEALPKANKKGGLRTIPFIISNEIFEKVATFGLHANMILYLTERYRMSSALATVVLYFWNALSNFLPIFGAVLADAYLGRFRVIALGSFVSLFGMCLLCLTAILPVFKKTPECAARPGECALVPWQLPLLFTSFVLMSVGSGGIRPCALAFGADQLDKRDNSAKNVRTLQTFFNWYYTVLGLSIVFAATVIVYIQQAKGWVVGFAVPVVLMVTALTLLLIGSPFYLKAEADRSVLVGLVQVLVASYKNRHEPLPLETADSSSFYNKAGSNPRTPTNKLRYLNRACVLRNPGKELSPDGTACHPWRLCTVQQVEDAKATIRVLPIWSTGIMPGVIIGQQMFPVLQAKTMERQMGKLEIPAASFGVFSILTLTVWVVVYDRALVRPLSRLTGHPLGLSLRQRMGAGLALFAVAMAVAAHTESVRRAAAIAEGLRDFGPHSGRTVHMSAMRLVPQHCLSGLAEGLNLIGQIEFYYSEFPKTMSSIGVSLLALGLGFGGVLGSAIVGIIGAATGRDGRDGWLVSNLNKGHYDYYYLVLAVLCAANVVYFVVCGWAYGEEGQNRVVAADAVEDAKEEQQHKAAIR